MLENTQLEMTTYLPLPHNDTSLTHHEFCLDRQSTVVPPTILNGAPTPSERVPLSPSRRTTARRDSSDDAARTSRAANDEAKLVFDLGKFSKEVHTDLSASLEYDLCAKAAALNVGFLNDVGLAEKNPEDDGKPPPAGVRAQLKTSIPVGDSLGLDDFANAEHKLKLYYLHESVGDIGVEFHPGKALDGKVEVSRDAYKLSVPFSKDGVDKDKITFEKSWMMDFA